MSPVDAAANQLCVNTRSFHVLCLSLCADDKHRSCWSSTVSNGLPGESEDGPFCWWIWLTRV